MYDDYYMVRAERHIDTLEEKIADLLDELREKDIMIMSLKQEIDVLRAQIQDLTRYLE